MDDQAEKMLARMAEAYRNIGEGSTLGEYEIGCAALSILRGRDSVTVDDLVRFFREKIDNSGSARGQIKPELDFSRVIWEAALSKLEALRAD